MPGLKVRLLELYYNPCIIKGYNHIPIQLIKKLFKSQMPAGNQKKPPKCKIHTIPARFQKATANDMSA